MNNSDATGIFRQFSHTCYLSVACVCFFSVLFQLGANAQPVPNLPTVRPDGLPLPSPNSAPQPPPQIPLLLPDPELYPPELEPPLLLPTEGSVFVSKFRFVGNTVVSTEQLEAATAAYVNRRLTFSELLDARAAVTARYVQLGYVTSGAYLAAEDNQSIDPESAVFTLRLVEGRVEDVVVTGDSRLRQYVRSRLRRATEPVLNQLELENALRLLQIDPLVKQISANLSVGSRFDLSLLSVDVEAAPVFALEPQLNNQRSPASGSFERAIEGSAANLLGAGERLQVGYRNTDGSNQWNVDFSIPINPSNATLSASYSTMDSRITEAPFDAFDIRSNSRLYQLSFRQPVIDWASDTQTQQFALGITAARLESETTLLGSPEPLSVGADAEGQTRITALEFFQEYSRNTASSFLLARSRLRFGLDVAGATINPDAVDSRFSLWRGQAVWLQRVFGHSQLLVRSEMQFADSSLPALEQFSLGGPFSVRGYRQDASLTDNGLFGSVELQVPLLIDGTSRFDVVPFLDAGIGWNGDDTPAPDSSLVAIGLGLQYRLSDILSVRVNYAFDLTNKEHGDSLQENGFDFALRGTFRF